MHRTLHIIQINKCSYNYNRYYNYNMRFCMSCLCLLTTMHTNVWMWRLYIFECAEGRMAALFIQRWMFIHCVTVMMVGWSWWCDYCYNTKPTIWAGLIPIQVCLDAFYYKEICRCTERKNMFSLLCILFRYGELRKNLSFFWNNDIIWNEFKFLPSFFGAYIFTTHMMSLTRCDYQPYEYGFRFCTSTSLVLTGEFIFPFFCVIYEKCIISKMQRITVHNADGMAEDWTSVFCLSILFSWNFGHN